MKSVHPQTKICPVCERPFQNRKKWASRNLWPDIKYCSQRCRVEAGKRMQER
ncbi:MAG: DUF2256 domain-containing protein [Granulosicoccus sp.]